MIDSRQITSSVPVLIIDSEKTMSFIIVRSDKQHDARNQKVAETNRKKIPMATLLDICEGNPPN